MARAKNLFAESSGFIRVKDAAIFLHVSDDTVRNRIAKGMLPAKKDGKCVLIEKKAFQAYVNLNCSAF